LIPKKSAFLFVEGFDEFDELQSFFFWVKLKIILVDLIHHFLYTHTS